MPFTFSETYREKCFHVWYGAQRPSKLETIVKLIPVDERGKKPSKIAIATWLQQDWMLRADQLDAKAIELADDQMIVEKAQMLKEQAARGKELQEKGMEHLKLKGFDSASAAVQAVIRGADLERSSRGIGELIVKMSKMTDGDLKEEIMKRLEKLSDDRIVDAEVKEQEPKEDTEEETN